MATVEVSAESPPVMPDCKDSALLVQIHALGADGAMWAETAALMEPSIRVWSPDLFGMGTVPRHASPPGISDHADHLAASLRDEDGPIVMAGCAIGSMIAAETAARLGDRVLGLIMANPILRITGPAADALKARAQRARAGGIESIADEVIARGFEGLGPDSQPEVFRRRLMTMSGDSYADMAEGIRGADVTDALRGLTCPVLLVPGGQDRVLPETQTAEIAALLPRARVVVAPSGGHFLPHQAPAEFAAIIRPFLSEIVTAPGS